MCMCVYVCVRVHVCVHACLQCVRVRVCVHACLQCVYRCEGDYMNTNKLVICIMTER